jgi:hypothetical protein
MTFLSACSGNTALEGRLAADSALESSQQASPAPAPSNSPNPLPAEIPLYPNLNYVSSETGSTPEQKITRWTSSDPGNQIEEYYQQQLPAKDWDIVQPFSKGEENNSLVARKNDLELQITLTNSLSLTELTITYQQNSNTVASPAPALTPTPTSLTFSDLEAAPESLRPYVEDLGKLGVLSGTQPGRFAPNQPITRRDFARWLLAANNQLYSTAAGKQIRTASATATPAFQDIARGDSDFKIIQGLAEAGIVPSPLTGDSTQLSFRPDAPLTRGDLLIWKVPLDARKALKTLPSGSIDSIKETWGFQDAAKMSADTLRSLYTDYQNGEQANVKRMLGYTTLFQPQKPVTRAEAAAALWYFGYQGDGISAADALQVPHS